MKNITSADNPQFKFLSKIAQSTVARRNEGFTLLDGVHLVAGYCQQIGQPERLVLSASGSERQEIQQLLVACASTPVLVLNDGLFKRLSTVASPTGVLAVAKVPTWDMPAQIKRTCIVLEEVQDPGNLGSILRSAAAVGIKDIFLSKNSADAWSPRVLRAGMCAHFVLRIHEQCDLLTITQAFKGRVIATSSSATQSLFDTQLTGEIAFIFGNEGAGLSQTLIAAAHDVVSIPISAGVESLNLAAAAAVCLFERLRQLSHLK